MCSGVIVMIRTITTCPSTSATMATGTLGRAQDAARSARAAPSIAVGRFVARTTCRPARTGRGAAATNDSSAASPTNTTGTRYGAGQVGQPERPRPADAGAARFGPMTAPIVAPQTTVPSADAAPLGREQVGRHVARQLVRRVAEADQHRPDEQQRQRAATTASVAHERRPATPTP